MGVTINNGDQHLYVRSHGDAARPGRTIVVQYDEQEAWLFELTDLERKALIQALTIPSNLADEPCYVGDHVPGCEHQAVVEVDDTPVHEPWCPMFHQVIGCTCGAEPNLRDPADDPHGAGTPAF